MYQKAINSFERERGFLPGTPTVALSAVAAAAGLAAGSEQLAAQS
jgi:hypothetical protein